MNSDRKQRITSIFHSAIEREGTERRAFLDGACANDEELRREVESLIRSHEDAGSLMDARLTSAAPNFWTKEDVRTGFDRRLAIIA